MESRLFETDLLTGHEPENRKSLEINEAILRFMEIGVGPGAMPVDHEPGGAAGGLRLRLRVRLRGELSFMGRGWR